MKTMRYLTESGAAALATSANMRALSYLYEVQSIIEETKDNREPLATREETARVESLIGQVRVKCLEWSDSIVRKIVIKEALETRRQRNAREKSLEKKYLCNTG